MNLREMSVNQLSELTGKDRRTIKERLGSTKPVREDKRGQYFDTRAALNLIFSSAGSPKGIEKQLALESLGLEKARREKIEIEVAKMRGDLVNIEDVAKVVERQYSIIRAQFRALPSKLAKLLSMISDPHEVFKIIQDEVNQVLTELTADKKYQDDYSRSIESFGEAADTGVETNVSAASSVESGSMVGSIPVSEPGGE